MWSHFQSSGGTVLMSSLRRTYTMSATSSSTTCRGTEVPARPSDSLSSCARSNTVRGGMSPRVSVGRHEMSCVADLACSTASSCCCSRSCSRSPSPISAALPSRNDRSNASCAVGGREQRHAGDDERPRRRRLRLRPSPPSPRTLSPGASKPAPRHAAPAAVCGGAAAAAQGRAPPPAAAPACCPRSRSPRCRACGERAGCGTCDAAGVCLPRGPC